MADRKKSKAAKKAAVIGVAAPAEDMRYRAEDALRTISRAEEHKRDKELMRHVKKLAKSHVKAVCK